MKYIFVWSLFTNKNHHNTAIFHSHQFSNQVHSFGRGDNSPRSIRRSWRDEGSQVCQQTNTDLTSSCLWAAQCSQKCLGTELACAPISPPKLTSKNQSLSQRPSGKLLMVMRTNYRVILLSFYSPSPSITRVYIFRNLEVQENLRVTDVQLPVRFFCKSLSSVDSFTS